MLVNEPCFGSAFVYLFKSAFSVEKWTFTGDEIIQELLDLQLIGYNNYPEIFAVQRDYCAPN